jgi:hypothetical protein
MSCPIPDTVVVPISNGITELHLCTREASAVQNMIRNEMHFLTPPPGPLINKLNELIGGRGKSLTKINEHETADDLKDSVEVFGEVEVGERHGGKR